ncbi:MAG: hypothetical protein GC162_09205 [Planctomycetes bacterium]|nr:hypothetical protein [Planctomycetota bacterium]
MQPRGMFALIVAAMLLAGVSAQAAVTTVFFDDFDTDPGTAGAGGRGGVDPNFADAWTELVDHGSDADAIADILPTGAGEAQFKSDGPSHTDNDQFFITRTIDATGYSNLRVSLALRESDTLEVQDTVKVQIDTGSGFFDVASVAGDFNNITLGPAPLGTTANNTTFQLRVAGATNVEDIFLDRIEVTSIDVGSEIYSDTFTISPNPAAAGATGRNGFTDGWTIELGETGGTRSVVNTAGDAVMHRTDSDTSPDENDYEQITHTFSTVGYRDITLDLTASQTNTTWESDDHLQILYSVDGVNFIPLLTDFGIWDGGGPSVGGTGNTTPTNTGSIAIDDPNANNNPNFAIRIIGFHNASSEDYHIQDISIQGFAIPTPAALPAGLALLTLTTLRRRRA